MQDELETFKEWKEIIIRSGLQLLRYFTKECKRSPEVTREKIDLEQD